MHVEGLHWLPLLHKKLQLFLPPRSHNGWDHQRYSHSKKSPCLHNTTVLQKGLQQRCALIRSKYCGRGYTVEVSQLEKCAAEGRLLDKMASEPENVPNESGGKPQEGGEGSEDLTQFVSDKMIILPSLINYVYGTVFNSPGWETIRRYGEWPLTQSSVEHRSTRT